MQTVDKRRSIIHVQNLFLISPLNIYLKRQTERYIIGYEPKTYRIHNALFKIEKSLIGKPQFDTTNIIQLNANVDINVREDFRNVIKTNDSRWGFKSKNITIRIINTRYNGLSPLYGILYTFNWRYANAGGTDELIFNIQECPTIANSNTVVDVCYKLLTKQISGGGTHGLYNYLVLSPKRGEFRIGDWLKASNINEGGHWHIRIKPVVLKI